MEIEVIKAESQDYQAGDVLSLGNPYGVKHFLLVDHINKTSIGAINLGTGTVEYLYGNHHGLGQLVKDILESNDWNEWTLIPKGNVKLTLDCRNNSPIPKDSNFQWLNQN